MNELGIALVWSAVQVTILAGTALLLAALAARRDARAGALVLAGGLAACVLVTLAAFCPLPPWWWCWRLTDAAAILDTPSPPAVARPTSGQEPGTSSLQELSNTGSNAALGRRIGSWLRGLLEGGEAARESTPGPQPRGFVLVTAVFGCGSILCLARVLLGLWAVRRWRRRSRPVADEELLTLQEAIRGAMGCRKPVEVRVCTGLSGAATLGWLRPLLLLPEDWRGWTKSELRAVLAHELAHIQAADYLTGLLARLSVALHFYHPLVYWLAGRLHLQQELAADALAARFAGGRGTYLRALARLALRQEEQPVGGPLRAFLPGRGTLMRRIQMLRNKEAKLSFWRAALRRGLALALLVAAALGVSALRVPADDVARAPAEAAAPAPAEETPFDISYLDENALGVVAVRPAALLRGAEMKPVADLVNMVLKVSFVALGLKADLGLPVEEIEQMTGSWVHLRDDTRPQGQKNSLTVNPVMVRAVRPFDWKKAIERVVGGEEARLLKVEHKGQAIWMITKDRLCFYLPDDRTLVLDTEARLRRLIERGKDSPPNHAWAASWRQVDRGWFAMALHTGNEEFRRAVEEGQANEPDLVFVAPFVKNARSIAFGIAGTEQIVCRAAADCETKDMASVVSDQARLAVTLGMTAAQAAAAKKDLEPLEIAALHFARDLAKSAKVGTKRGDRGVLVEVRAEAKTKLADLLTEFVGAEMKAQGLERK